MTDYTDLHRRLWQLIQAQDGRLDQGAQALVQKLKTTLGHEGYRMTPEIEGDLTRYAEGFENDLLSGIHAATRLGSPREMRDDLVAKLAERALSERWADGHTLSQRLWGWQRGFRQGFADVLADGARRGASVNSLVYDLQRKSHYGATFQIAHNETEDWATELADIGRRGINTPTGRRKWNEMVATIREDYLPGLTESGTKHAAQTAFKKIVKAVEAGNQAAIDEAVAWWMYDKQLYLLKRIARTEMATAQHRAVIASTEEDEDIIGYHWRLSGSHPEPDICDYYASIDMGLGKGVWSKEAVPRHKAHPHCMCTLVPRVTPVKEPGSTNYAEFINNVTPERRAQLLPKWVSSVQGLGQPLEGLIKPDGRGLISRDEFRQRLGEERFGAVDALGKALEAPDWGTRTLKAGKMTQRALAEFAPFSDIPEVRALLDEIQAGQPIDGLRLKYLKRKYPEGEDIGGPEDLNTWFKQVLRDPASTLRVRPGPASRFAVHNLALGKAAIIDPSGQRVTVYNVSDTELEPVWMTLADLLNLSIS